MPTLGPTVVAYGPPASWDALQISGVTLVRVRSLQQAVVRTLTDRNVVAAIVVESGYAPAYKAVKQLRASAARLPIVARLLGDGWPAESLWTARRGVYVVEVRISPIVITQIARS